MPPSQPCSEFYNKLGAMTGHTFFFFFFLFFSFRVGRYYGNLGQLS